MSDGLMAPDLVLALVGVYAARCRGGNGLGIDQILPADRTRFYGYGRQALAEALSLAGVGKGDEVLLPGLLCGEVLASLAVVGAIPKFYAVDELLNADPESWNGIATKNVRAVVAVNYFGFPQSLGWMREWCRAHGAVLIEDNAHGFLSEDGDVPLGRRGDLGVFSLRKTLALPNGAALVDNRVGKIEAGELSYKDSCRLVDFRYRSKVILKRLIEWGGLGSARTILACIRMIRLVATGNAIPASSPRREISMPQEAYSSLTPPLLRRCDYSVERQRRRALYQLCRELFAHVPDVHLLFDTLPDGVVPQGFPFFYGGNDSHSFINVWWQRGLPILSWPDSLPSVLSDVPPYYRNIMLVPFLW